VKDTANALLKFASPNPLQQQSQPSKVIAATDFGGTYNGAWRSNKFNAAGRASMVMNISESEVRAEITLSGSRITKEVLYGKAAENSDGWEVSLRTANGDLTANGTFKNGAFDGDYDYAPAADRGRWLLKKD
jgi:autotransporter translocation and assembly factor TamB